MLIVVPGGLTRQWVDEMAEKFFLRRVKEEMVDWSQQPLFRPRYTKTVGYDLTTAELDLYNAVTKYVRSHRKEARAKKNRNVELTVMVMQRRLASSIYAVTCTLRGRLAALDDVLRDPRRSLAEVKRLLKSDGEDIPRAYADYEDLDEEERDAIEKKIFRQVLSDDPEAVEEERNEVCELLRVAEGLHKKQSLAWQLDLADARQLRDASDERRLQPLFMRNFFMNAWRAAGDALRAGDHFAVYHIGPVPAKVLDVAMRYERSRGWQPFDISADGEHYDLRSEGPNGERRFIEVKGRAASGGIVLTAPERDKLEQLGDRAYLYIVTCCAGERVRCGAGVSPALEEAGGTPALQTGDGIRSMPAALPRLRIIQDPMAQLHPAMLYRQVQYFVTEADWRRHGDDHDCPPPD